MMVLKLIILLFIITQRRSTVSVHEKVITSLCEKASAYEKLIAFATRINNVDHLCVNCLYVDHWLPWHWSLICPNPPGSTVSITSALIINCLYINHWSAPPKINSIDHLCVDHQSPLCWSLIHPTPGSTVSITSASTVDQLPYRFSTF